MGRKDLVDTNETRTKKCYNNCWQRYIKKAKKNNNKQKGSRLSRGYWEVLRGAIKY